MVYKLQWRDGAFKIAGKEVKDIIFYDKNGIIHHSDGVRMLSATSTERVNDLTFENTPAKKNKVDFQAAYSQKLLFYTTEQDPYFRSKKISKLYIPYISTQWMTKDHQEPSSTHVYLFKDYINHLYNCRIRIAAGTNPIQKNIELIQQIKKLIEITCGSSSYADSAMIIKNRDKIIEYIRNFNVSEVSPSVKNRFADLDLDL